MKNLLVRRKVEIINVISGNLNVLQTLTVRSKNTQHKLVEMFSEVSEIVQGLEIDDPDKINEIVELYTKIGSEHEFSAETFTEMSKTVVEFLNYLNIMYGYVMAERDLQHNESVTKRRKRQCRKRVGQSFQRQRGRVQHGIKQGGFLE